MITVRRARPSDAGAIAAVHVAAWRSAYPGILPDGYLARLSARDLAELQVKQTAILGQAARLVRSGGRLVYATCSLLTEENEAQVQSFLAAHPDFAVVPLARAWDLPAAPPCPGPFLTLTPLRHGTDGFFAAVLERAA